VQRAGVARDLLEVANQLDAEGPDFQNSAQLDEAAVLANDLDAD
jgi:hypothetical protein